MIELDNITHFTKSSLSIIIYLITPQGLEEIFCLMKSIMLQRSLKK